MLAGALYLAARNGDWHGPEKKNTDKIQHRTAAKLSSFRKEMDFEILLHFGILLLRSNGCALWVAFSLEIRFGSPYWIYIFCVHYLLIGAALHFIFVMPGELFHVVVHCFRMRFKCVCAQAHSWKCVRYCYKFSTAFAFIDIENVAKSIFLHVLHIRSRCTHTNIADIYVAFLSQRIIKTQVAYENSISDTQIGRSSCVPIQFLRCELLMLLLVDR